MTTHKDKSKDVSDERIVRLLRTCFEMRKRLGGLIDRNKTCRYVAKKLRIDIERVERVERDLEGLYHYRDFVETKR